jgi:hypothetical protein
MAVNAFPGQVVSALCLRVDTCICFFTNFAALYLI